MAGLASQSPYEKNRYFRTWPARLVYAVWACSVIVRVEERTMIEKRVYA